ncbi:hypothetical protein [Sphingomonas radiodurans]|uniref:hypothetical protein n=1 Tax=Sphingomonas radiodurans TaxID=2890321 RepID=UPI001E4484EF|nr:hypothetical protein [Sphingomonas radiodurans]WBH16709.1 hypothetical protein LLW23_00860 [Sphingomonas radiodurans]
MTRSGASLSMLCRRASGVWSQDVTLGERGISATGRRLQKTNVEEVEAVARFFSNGAVRRQTAVMVREKHDFSNI